MSLIDLGTTAYIANTTTEAVFGTNAWNFLTDGWLGRSPSSATDNSYELSLYELMTGALGLQAYQSTGTGVYGVASSQSNQADYAFNVIKNNLRANGGRLFGTVLVAPVIAKVSKKLLARPLINPINRGLKQLGLSQALGVKL